MPQATYYTRFLATDGSQITKTWTSETENINFLRDSKYGKALSLKLIDRSKGNGAIVTYVDQQTFGGGAGLRARTQLVANLAINCTKLEDFAPLPVYDSRNDVYSTLGTDAEMRKMQWPFTGYFTRYLATDGSHVTVRWYPVNTGNP